MATLLFTPRTTIDANIFQYRLDNSPFYAEWNVWTGSYEFLIEEEAIDNFTRHTHENRFGIEGWKTNNGHMLNKKFIIEGIMETQSYMGFNVRHSSYNLARIDDLVKVLCNITATDYNSIGSLYRFNYDKTHNKMFTIEPNTWYIWGFFEVKFFKKGTMHVKFIDNKVWYKLNKAYGELKGFTLPEQYNNK